MFFWSTFPSKNQEKFCPSVSWAEPFREQKKKQFLSFRKKVFIFCFLHFFLQKKILASFFFNTSFVSPLFFPFFLPPFSLLVPLLWFLSSSWIFLSSFFSSTFFFCLFHFVLFVLFFSVLEHMFFLVPLVLPSGYNWFSWTFCPHLQFFFNFWNTKKSSLWKVSSLFFCDFELCFTSPFVFNSCITCYSFLSPLKKDHLKKNLENFLFFCFFVFSFLLPFHLDCLFLFHWIFHFVHLVIQKKTPFQFVFFMVSFFFVRLKFVFFFFSFSCSSFSIFL